MADSPVAGSPPAAVAEDEAAEQPEARVEVSVTPSKLKAISALILGQRWASPPRWGWICRMVDKLIISRLRHKIDGQLMAMLTEQAQLLDARAPQALPAARDGPCEPAAAIAAAPAVEKKRRAKRPLFKETEVKPEEARLKALRARRERVASPQKPLKFARDTLCRVHITPS